MERTVFFEDSLMLIPDYNMHETLVSQRNFKAALSVVEKLMARGSSFTVFGGVLQYHVGVSRDLSLHQYEIRRWVNEVRSGAAGRKVLAIVVSMEKAREGLHSHALVFTQPYGLSERKYAEALGDIWTSITNKAGYYYNQNSISDQSDYEFENGDLGLMAVDDYTRIQRLCAKIWYNTKSGCEPNKGEEGKRKCFICEEYE